jgi:hypothetical protein
VDRAAAILDRLPPVTFYLVHAYGWVAEVYLALWASAPPPEAGAEQSAERRALERAARRACKAGLGLARVFPIAVPGAWLHQGRLEQLAGKHARAHRAWARSLEAAIALRMPFDEALARLEIALDLPPGDARRREHLRLAARRFADCGAADELAKAREALGEPV